MMSDIPKAGTIAWYEYYAGKVIELTTWNYQKK